MRPTRWGVTAGVCLALMLSGVPSASAAGPTWRREPGGSLTAVTIGTNGHVYVTGSIRGKGYSRALVVAKYGPHGRLVWRRTWRVQRHDWHAIGESLAPAPDGGVYVGGASGYGEGADALLIRYAPDGHRLWERTVATREGHARVAGLAATDGGVIAAIDDHGCCAIWDHEGHVQAFGADGSLGWRRDFEVPWIPVATWDAATAVAVGAGGRIFVGGEVDRAEWLGYPKPLPDEDRVVQALSPGGRVLWTRVMGRAGIRKDDRIRAIATGGGLVVATGESATRAGAKPWVGAFDTDGARSWTRVLGRGRRYRSARAVTVAPWGPIFVGVEASLHRYSKAGALLAADLLPGRESVTGAVASGALYLTSGHELQRWPRA